MLRALWWLAAAVLLALPAAAPAAFYSRGEGHLFTLADEVSYMRAARGSTFESVSSQTSGWTSQAQRPFEGGEGTLDYWARFDLSPAPTERRLLLETVPWERIEYYFVTNGRLLDRQVVGTTVPRWQRNVQITMTWILATDGFVALEVPAGETTRVYARLTSSQNFTPVTRMRFSVWDERKVREGERRDRLLQGVYFGALLVLILYNLGLYFFDQRHPSYLYYAASMFFAGLIMAAFFGLSAEHLWPDTPWWDFYALFLAISLGFSATVQFIRHYLASWREYPLADRLLKLVLVACLSLTPVILGPVIAQRPMTAYTEMQITVAVGTVGVLALFGVSVLALARGHPGSRLLAAAFVCGGGGTLLSFMTLMGFLPLIDPLVHANQIGVVLMGILLSLGIGMRMRALRAAHERELERKVAERTAELSVAQQKADGLLANILPQAIVRELKEKGASEPRRYEEATILFTDFAGFTETVGTIPPRRLVQELDQIFRAFDEIIAEHGLEKIKTIGDAYMAAAGLPTEAPDHAKRCVRAALALQRCIERRNAEASIKWGLRVGVHSGTVVAGIVGKTKYAYDVWGDTVNVASRLESAGQNGRVNISAYTHDLVRDAFECEYRGKLSAKGKGEIDMYFVVSERAVDSSPQAASSTTAAAR